MTTPNTVLITGITDPPYRGNLIKDQSGQETQPPDFSAIITQVWSGWMRTLTQWANLQGQTTAIPYQSSDYATQTGIGVWAVSSGQLTNATYRLVGDTLMVNYLISGSTVTGGTLLVGKITLPDLGIGNYIVTEIQRVPASIVQGGVTLTGGAAEVTGSNQVLIFADSAIAAGTVDVAFSLAMGIDRR
jgi:hypothetical protein